MPDAINSDRIPALAQTAVTQHQSMPFYVEPSSPHDLGIVGWHPRRTHDRLTRLP